MAYFRSVSMRPMKPIPHKDENEENQAQTELIQKDHDETCSAKLGRCPIDGLRPIRPIVYWKPTLGRLDAGAKRREK